MASWAALNPVPIIYSNDRQSTHSPMGPPAAARRALWISRLGPLRRISPPAPPPPPPPPPLGLSMASAAHVVVCMKIPSFCKNIWVSMALNGCALSDCRALKFPVSHKEINGINWFLCVDRNSGKFKVVEMIGCSS